MSAYEHQKNEFPQPLDPVTATEVTHLTWELIKQDVASEHFVFSAMPNIAFAKLGNEISPYLSTSRLRGFLSNFTTLFSYADIILKMPGFLKYTN